MASSAGFRVATSAEGIEDACYFAVKKLASLSRQSASGLSGNQAKCHLLVRLQLKDLIWKFQNPL